MYSGANASFNNDVMTEKHEIKDSIDVQPRLDIIVDL